MKGKTPNWEKEITELCDDFDICDRVIAEIIERTKSAVGGCDDEKMYRYAHRLFLDHV